MKKKLLTMLAVITAIATLAACGSEETNNDTTPTPTTTAAVQNESNASEPAPTTAPTQQTTTPTETTTEQTTTEPPIEPLTWENSGIELKLNEFEKGTTIATLTNTSENTYIIDAGIYAYGIAPGETAFYNSHESSDIRCFSFIDCYRIATDADSYAKPVLLESTTKNSTNNGTELTFIVEDAFAAMNCYGIVILFDADNNVIGVTYCERVNDNTFTVTIPNDTNYTVAKLSVNVGYN